MVLEVPTSTRTARIRAFGRYLRHLVPGFGFTEMVLQRQLTATRRRKALCRDSGAWLRFNADPIRHAVRIENLDPAWSRRSSAAGCRTVYRATSRSAHQRR